MLWFATRSVEGKGQDSLLYTRMKEERTRRNVGEKGKGDWLT
jgi:hypothetical protein